MIGLEHHTVAWRQSLYRVAGIERCLREVHGHGAPAVSKDSDTLMQIVNVAGSIGDGVRVGCDLHLHPDTYARPVSGMLRGGDAAVEVSIPQVGAVS